MRTHTTENITTELLGKTITVCGWVHRRRDHGGLIFIDLRDRDGLLQIVCDPKFAEPFKAAEECRNEFVIQVEGTLRQRPTGTENPKLHNGTIELVAHRLNILNRSKPLPFSLDEYQEVGEEVRLKYRYLDLRRPEIAARIKMRSHITQYIRHFFNEQGFFDIETPFLTRATPEGARDFLVPSRHRAGDFYALPQSPQLFKQLLMMSGMDRYYQIVRCFRDEDLRADRQPEFTQLDVEMAFIEEKDIQTLIEEMLRGLFKKILNVTLPNPFPRLTFQEAMSRFGSDKPDLRIPLELVEISDLVKNVEFAVFRDAANSENSRVAALKLSVEPALTRKQIDDYTAFVGRYGAKGLAYIKVNDLAQGIAGLQSPILKFLPEDVVLNIMKKLNAKNGDIIFFGAGPAKIVNDSLGALRCKLGADLNLYTSEWEILWVVDFPMFEMDKGRLQAMHHPFTAPKENNAEKLLQNPGAAIARAYDVALNGFELGGGSIRMHQIEMQETVFQLLGISKEKAWEKFPHLLNALQFGAPPHGGIAFGIDRIAMLMGGGQSLRDVIAFPKTQSGSCPLTEAPSTVDAEQLEELHIRVNTKEPVL